MSNHIHLLIREREDTIGMAIKRIASSYVYYYNHKYSRDCHLFSERFKSETVNDMAYFLTLLRYIIHRILMCYHGRNSFVDETEKGYLPLRPKKLKKQLELKQVELNCTELSSTKVERFKATLSRAKEKGVKVVVVDSPMYRLCDMNNKSAVEMQNICNMYGALFLNNSQLPEFVEHKEFFNDPTHMNTIGAVPYTKMFLNQMKNNFIK